MRRRTPVLNRLLRRVDMQDGGAGCWIFTGAIGNHGYGVIGLGGRADGLALTHRVVYEGFHGPIPDGLHVDHLCNNRACCNPNHLEAVTQAENNKRMARRGRDCGPPQEVRDEIARRRIAGEARGALAREYGFSEATIWVYTKKYKQRMGEAC